MPPDPNRQYVSKAQYKQVFLDGTQADGHGFAYIDPAQLAASNGAAGYYSWSPVPGFRFIALDTVSEGGDRRPVAPTATSTTRSSSGCAHSSRRRDRGQPAGRHLQPPRDPEPDLAGAGRGGAALHGVDDAPRPRRSTPAATSIRATPRRSTSAQDLADLLHQYPDVIAWVAGHSHVNDVEPYPGPNGTGLLEHPHRRRGRLAAAEPPARGDGQPATARSRSSARSSTTRATRPLRAAAPRRSA